MHDLCMMQSRVVREPDSIRGLIEHSIQKGLINPAGLKQCKIALLFHA